MLSRVCQEMADHLYFVDIINGVVELHRLVRLHNK